MGWSAAARPGRVGMPAAYADVATYDDAGPSTDDDRLRVSDVGKLGRRLRRGLVRTARFDDRPSFPKLLAAHLGTDVDQVEVVEESWPAHDLVNVQVGLVAFLGTDGVGHELVGMRNHRRVEFGLADLLRPSDTMRFGPEPGNVAWTRLATGPDGQVTPAALAAVYLVTAQSLPAFHDGPVHLALMLRAADPEYDRSAVQLHLVADRPGAASAAAAEIRRLAMEHNVYRGQVITFNHEMFGERASALQFRRRPTVSADDVILPAETLQTMHRQVLGVARHREALLAAGQHLKRGVLLHGPPGVGKTHSLRYLIAQMTDVTVLELSGDSLAGIATACSVGRSLQPAMIVVEDVDLIAEDREIYDGPAPCSSSSSTRWTVSPRTPTWCSCSRRTGPTCSSPLSRPGRAGSTRRSSCACPTPTPDGACSSSTAASLEVDVSDLDARDRAHRGVTASFLKELLRRAALIAAESGAADGVRLSVTRPPDEALEELMDTRNAMTRTLSGVADTRRRRWTNPCRPRRTTRTTVRRRDPPLLQCSCRWGGVRVVELRGFEPLTFSNGGRRNRSDSLGRSRRLAQSCNPATDRVAGHHERYPCAPHLLEPSRTDFLLTSCSLAPGRFPTEPISRPRVHSKTVPSPQRLTAASASGTPGPVRIANRGSHVEASACISPTATAASRDTGGGVGSRPGQSRRTKCCAVG